MRKTLIKIVGAACFALPFALPVAAHATPQQDKMKQCNKDATGKKGDDRKSFMSTCLSAKAEAPAAPMTQQEKMKKCNVDATGKKGDERKAFMSTCLKG